MIEDLSGLVEVTPVWVKLAQGMGYGIQVGRRWYYRPEEEALVRVEAARLRAEKAAIRRTRRIANCASLREKKAREKAAGEISRSLRLAVAAARRLLAERSTVTPIDAASEVAKKYGVEVGDVARLLRQKPKERKGDLYYGRCGH